MKKRIITLLCIAILGGGGYFGVKAYQRERDEKKVVSVVPLKSMVSTTVLLNRNDKMYGDIAATNSQRIYVDTKKLIQNVNVRQGQQVKKGDVILEYDMTVVELELAQKENRLREIEQEIVMQKKELERLKGLRPAEERPSASADSEPEIQPDDSETDRQEKPAEPLRTLAEVGAGVEPVSGTGTADDPLIFLCNTRSVVRKSFQLMLAGSGADLHVSLCVFDDSDNFLYQWRISAKKINPKTAAEWKVTDGLIFDENTGEVLVNPEGELHAQLSLSRPDLSVLYPESSALPEETEQPEDMLPEINEPEEPDYGEDYLYPRSKLQSLIIAKESEIKNLEISLKSANLAFETAKKQKTDGKVVAEIDGVVKKIGKLTDAETTEPEETDDASEDDDDNAFAVIEGAGGLEFVCEVSEYEYFQMPVGTKLTIGGGYGSDAVTTGKITGYDTEPVKYGGEAFYYENPNSSIYRMHASLDNSADFRENDSAEATLADSENVNDGTTAFMPMYYLKEEDGNFYALVADENDRLVKKRVQVGVVYPAGIDLIEIRGGLDIEHDRICFPYGTDVKEGIKTRDTTEFLLPSGMM